MTKPMAKGTNHFAPIARQSKRAGRAAATGRPARSASQREADKR